MTTVARESSPLVFRRMLFSTDPAYYQNDLKKKKKAKAPTKIGEALTPGWLNLLSVSQPTHHQLYLPGLKLTRQVKL